MKARMGELRLVLFVGAAVVSAAAGACSRSSESRNLGEGGAFPSEDAMSSDAGSLGPGGASSGSDAEHASSGGAPSTGGRGTLDARAVPDRDATLPDVTFSYVSPSDDASLDPDSACASSTTVAEPLPLDMYVMLDRSGSMNIPKPLPPATGGDCDVGSSTVSRWCFAINALDGFFSSPGSAGTGVALQFFPGNECSAQQPDGDTCCHEGECCQGADDAVALVPLAPLPEHLDALTAALNEREPSGTTTPIEAALRGMSTWARSRRQSGRTVASVLITDGAATSCEASTEVLAELVRQHHEQDGSRTFLVGMSGADFTLLEALAEAGGSPGHTDFCPGGLSECHSYNVENGNPSAFQAALEQIRETAVGCTFAMPRTDAGLVDPENVELRFSTTKVSESVQPVDGPEQCDDGKGFYYDEKETPAHISLCPASCEALQGRPGSRIEVLLGCLQG